MQVQVTGIHLDVGTALRGHVIDRLEASVGKYFDRPVDGTVTFAKEGHEYRADCAVHLSSGMRLNAQARATDIYASFDAATDRLEKRLRRYKRRLKDHHNSNKPSLPAEEVPSFVIAAGDDESAIEGGSPAIIAEETTQIPSLSVGDAAMQMDISDAPFVVFRNGANGGLNIVYRRDDGHIGWIDATRDTKDE